MTFLFEGMSLVFESLAMNERYLDGINGFRLARGSGSFSTVRTISQLSFFESDDGLCKLIAS